MSIRSAVLSRLSSYGLSQSGKDFVLKALDPAGVGSSPGIPDTSACPVLRPEYTVQYSIPTPSVTTSNWDCMLVFPPGDTVAAVYAYGPSGTDFSANVVPSGGGVGFIPLQPSTDVPGVTGWVVCTPTGNSQQSLSLRLPNSGALAFRHSYKSVTVELIAAAVNDQGDVYAAQYPTEPFQRKLLTSTVDSVTTGYPLLFGLGTIRIPFDEADLTLSSRDPYVGKAKEGVYMPLHLQGPTQEFAGGSQWYAGTSGFGGLLPVTASGIQAPSALYYSNEDFGGVTPSPFINGWGVASNVQYDTGHDKVMTGVIIFRGIAASTGGGFGSTIMVKLCVGHEVCPKPTQFNRVFLKEPAVYDPLAMQAYYSIMSTLGHAYPARYNSLGLLMPMIMRALSVLGPAVVSGGKAFIRALSGTDQPVEQPTLPANKPKKLVVKKKKAKTTGKR